jgi:putative N6-adenine-specific DNA methylase
VPAPLQCYAVTTPGLELVLAAELTGLRLTPGEASPGGIAFAAHHSGLYRANLELRSASRVLVRVAAFHAHSFFELERHAAAVPWDRFVPPGGAVAFRVTSKKSKLYHQDAVAERLGRAVVAAVAGAVVGERGTGNGEWDEEGPPAPTSPLPAPQLFVARLWRDELILSADASGELLHRRGYRLATAKAPMRESLAAAMLLAAGWDGSAPLVDPFCGAGTIPIEAALLARRLAPGRRRPFAFERWPSFEGATWSRIKHDAEARVLPRAPAPVAGFDRDAGAVEAARANAERAGVGADAAFGQQALSAFVPPAGGPGWVVTNPPWGVRVGARAALRDLYASLGRVLTERAPGWTVILLSADRRLEAATGLDWEPLFHATSGGVDVRALRARVPG